MAKVTKSVAGTSSAPAASSTPAVQESKQPAGGTNTIIDISKLTPEQLASLQKQLKQTKKASAGDSKERFNIIETMLKEKDEAGEFKHTTRDIMNTLKAEKLIAPVTADDEQEEIKKIQARKQFLEKRRDEKGELMHPEGTFGYKASAGFGFKLTGARVVEWFTEENVATLTDEQRESITKALEV